MQADFIYVISMFRLSAKQLGEPSKKQRVQRRCDLSIPQVMVSIPLVYLGTHG